MSIRIISFLFLASVSISTLAQSQAQSGVKHTSAVPVSTKNTAVTSPPINNIASSPKVISKKKRKTVQVTVAEKHTPAAKQGSK